jgi:hypothetical protein
MPPFPLAPAAHAARPWLAALALLAATATASEIQSLNVTRDGPRYRVEMEVTLRAPAAASYAAFATPANLPLINPAVREARLLQPSGGEPPRLYTEVHVCAMLYCKTLRQTQQMHYAPRPDGGELHAEVLPAQSDFEYGRAEWRFDAAGATTRMHFSAELQPAFWVPPLLGPWLVERSLREEAETTSAGIERLAAAPAAPP